MVERLCYMIPYLTLFILLWIVITRVKKRNAELESARKSKEFWDKENKSNLIRKKDISNLEYISIPLSSLPFNDTPDEDLDRIQKMIETLSTKQIVNLTGKSNTDLKLEYGPANLTSLTTFDQNFTLLARTINQWGKYLYEHGKISDAQTVLEFGISCKTDVSQNYLLLASIYKEQNEVQKIEHLIDVANSLETLMKNSIISSLKSIQKG